MVVNSLTIFLSSLMANSWTAAPLPGNEVAVQQCSTFRKKSWGQLALKFSFFSARTSILVAKNYINGFSFVKDNGLSLVYVFPKKKVTYLGGQVGDQA